MADDPSTRFPKSRLRRRVFYSTEERLGSLPMVVAVPTIAAITGAAATATYPTLTVRNGLVVGQASFGEALLTGVIGGLIGLLAIVGLIFVATWVWYRLLGGDAIWEAVYGGCADENTRWHLQCRSDVGPVDPIHLGTTEVRVKTPSRGVVGNRLDMGPFFQDDPPGTWMWVHTGIDPGRYEVRWYATREGQRTREIARSTVMLDREGKLT